MSTLKTHNLQSPDAGSVNIVMAPNSGMVVAGLSTYSNQINVGNNIKLGTAGVVTATSFVGGLPITSGADNRVITASSANAIQGESTLTYDGNDLQNLQTNAAANLILKATSNSFNSIILDSNRSASTQFAVVDGKWNGTVVNRIQFVTGTDGTNKDDGYMAFHTRESGQSLTERLRINSYGQVGVNTTSPSAQFGIAVDSNNTNALATGGIALSLKNTNTTDNSWVCMDFNNSVGGIVARFGAQFKDTSDKDTDLYFATRADGGNLTEALRIDSSGYLSFAGDTDTYIWHPSANQLAITRAGGSTPMMRWGTGGNGVTVGINTDGNLVTNSEILSVRGYASFKSFNDGYAAIYTHNEEENNSTIASHILFNVSGANRGGFGYDTDNSTLIMGNQNSISFKTGATQLNGTERLRIDTSGHVSLRNSTNSHQEIQWYSNNSKSATIGWGNGSANWEFKHYRADNQADNPYANIDFFTGSTTSPTRALRITEDGNHIREKHSRFACQITYQNKWYSQGEIIQFNTHVNVGNDFDNSNNKYTAPVDGTYYFFFHTNVIRNGSGTYYTDWYKNGSTIVNSLGGRMYDYYTGSGWNNLSGFIGLDLSEGDYISVHSGSADTKYDGNTYGQLIGYLVG